MPDITDYALTVIGQWFEAQGYTVKDFVLYSTNAPTVVDLRSLAEIMQMEKLLASNPSQRL